MNPLVGLPTYRSYKKKLMEQYKNQLSFTLVSMGLSFRMFVRVQKQCRLALYRESIVSRCSVIVSTKVSMVSDVKLYYYLSVIYIYTLFLKILTISFHLLFLLHQVSGPRSYDVIAKEYHAARLEATKAKEKKDKKSQEQAGNIIRKLKQELSALG